MKIRFGFVSNSSSTAFIIWNKTNENRTLVDFVKENPQLLSNFLENYDWKKEQKEIYNLERMVRDAIELKMIWGAERKEVLCFWG